MHILFVCSHSSYHEKFRENATFISIVTANTNLALREGPKEKIYDNFILISTEELATKLFQIGDKINRQNKIDIVISIADDYIELGMKMASYLNVPFFPNAVANRIVNNKVLARQYLHSLGLDSTPFSGVNNSDEVLSFIEMFGLPIILKPVKGSGSSGVTVIDTESQVEEALNYFTNQAPGYSMMVEKFIEGDEYSVEMFSEDKLHVCISVVKKFKSKIHCVGEGHLLPAVISDSLRSKIVKFVTNILTALGIESGPSHTEIIISKDKMNLYFIETHLRAGGGSLTELIRHVWGLDLIELWSLQFSKKKVLSRIMNANQKYKFASVAFYTPPQVGIIEAINTRFAYHIPGVIKATNFRPLGVINQGRAFNSGQRALYAIAVGNNPQETEKNAREAVKKIICTITQVK